MGLPCMTFPSSYLTLTHTNTHTHNSSLRSKMCNAAGVLLVLCHLLLRFSRSEADRIATAAHSVHRRSAIPCIIPPATAPAAPTAILLAPHLLKDLGRFSQEGAATLSHAHAALQAVGHCLPHVHDYAANFCYFAKSTTNSSLLFSNLLSFHTLRFRIVPVQAAAPFHSALHEARIAAGERVHSLIRNVADGGAAASASAPSASASASSSAPAADPRKIASDWLKGGRQGSGSGALKRLREDPPALDSVEECKELPAIAPQRVGGRPLRGGQQEQLSTVTGVGLYAVEISATNQLRILQAVKALPPNAHVSYVLPNHLFQRRAGAAFVNTSAAEARKAPQQRSSAALALIDAAHPLTSA